MTKNEEITQIHDKTGPSKKETIKQQILSQLLWFTNWINMKRK